MIFITRTVTFNAAHRLHNPTLTDEENKKIFGICNNPNGHGHNYTLEVTVQGEVSEKTGMVINLKELRNIVVEHIVQKVDHKNLNYDVDFMKDVIPTAENMVILFWDILTHAIPEEKGTLYELRLFETRSNSVVYRG